MCMVMDVNWIFAVTISQYVQISNHSILYLKLICCMSIIPQLSNFYNF